MADESGNWLADFSPYPVSFTSGTNGWVAQYGDSWNATVIRWYIPEPRFEVSLTSNVIHGWDWRSSTDITLFIDDGEISNIPSDGYGRVVFEIDSIEITSGMKIVLTDGLTTLTHWVRDIEITNIDQEADTISGMADADSWVGVSAIKSPNYHVLSVQADGAGVWEANFSEKMDITAGTLGSVMQFDEQGNSTSLSWFIPDPVMMVMPFQNVIHGFQWPASTEITLSIGDAFTMSTHSSIYGYFLFDTDPFDIDVGQVITLTGGGYTRTHTVRQIAVTDVNLNSDDVIGSADAGSLVNIIACYDSDCDSVSTFADGAGIWLANFSTLVDIMPGSYGEAWQTDEAGNSTRVLWVVSPPAIISPDHTLLTAGEPGEFIIVASGLPVPNIERQGILPVGVFFEDRGDGTARFYGTPDSGQGGDYIITITASNGLSPDATQVFTLTIEEAVVDFSCENVTIPELECEALVALYQSTNGGQWDESENWLVSADPANWFGVSVESDRVTSLNLSENKLKGTLPEAFFNLPMLQNLDLSGNELSGSLSAQFGSFSELVILNLQSNEFNGQIPSELGGLTNLTVLRLNHNTFSGAIPLDLADLSQLSVLMLNENLLTGEIPPGLGDLVGLTELRLDNNRLSGSIPESLSSLILLEMLDFTNNQLTGEIPESLTNLTSLSSLGLRYNRLTVPATPEELALFLAGLDPNWYKTQAKTESVPTSGGSVVSRDETTIITVEEATFEDEVLFTFIPQPVPTQTTGSMGFAGQSFQLTASSGGDPITAFPAPVIVTIYYDESTLGNIPEESLKLYYWDEEGDPPSWVDVVTTCGFDDEAYQRDLVENWIKVPICHLSEFSVMGDTPPVFTSENQVTFNVSQNQSFTISALGYPEPTIACLGELPVGVECIDHGNGTATLSGTPAGGQGGVYPLTITASNRVTGVDQQFTLTVNEAPTITSGHGASFTVNAAGVFTITTWGFPHPEIIVDVGLLPKGVAFKDNGDGTATLSGTPEAGQGGAYPLTITASNPILQNVQQQFTLTVNEAPAITSGLTASFTVNEMGGFTITTTGFPRPEIIVDVGLLPKGVAFRDNGDGTATLSGTPEAGQGGVYPLTITASNGITPDASQVFTLTVNEELDDQFYIFLPLVTQ